MATYSSHPLRGLSPITELTTPTSLRTLTLPLEEADYEPERPRRPAGDVDDADSVYSSHSGETVKQDRPSIAQERTGTPIPISPRNRKTSLPPAHPPRSPRRPKPAPLPLLSDAAVAHGPPLSSRRAVAFPNSAPPPGGLHPPPRSLSIAKQAVVRRATPPPSPLHPQMKDGSSSLERVDETFKKEPGSLIGLYPGMAGVGAGGRSRPTSLRSRPNSFHASPSQPSTPFDSPKKAASNNLPEAPVRPALISQHSHPTLHNVPLFTISPDASPRKDSTEPSRSRPNSLKKQRPKTYHGSTSSSRRNSYHGEVTQEPVSSLLIAPSLPLGAVIIPVQAQFHYIQPAPASLSDSSLAPHATRPPLLTRRSETSLPSRSPSRKSLTRRKSPTRRHRVSSILSSIFGNSAESTHNKNDVARKLSKRSRNTSPSSATGMASKGSSRDSSPFSPASPATESQRLNNDPLVTLPAAIRMSGTFGIQDDGSDIHPHPLGHNPVLIHHEMALNRTQSGNGSVTTQSDGMKRILYVQNGHEHDLIEEDETLDTERTVNPFTGDPPKKVTVDTVPDEDEPRLSAPQPHQREFAYTGPEPRGVPLHTGRVSSPAATLTALPLSQRTSTGSDYYGLDILFAPQRGLSTPSPTEARHSIVHLALPLPSTLSRAGTIDEGIQTSSAPSPSKSPSNRPLARPPSRQASPHIRVPQPTFIAPPPPESMSSAKADLPLLIASHLLSTHAAALMRHSRSMKDAGEIMHKMAKESLDWGGVLMNLADKQRNGDSATVVDGEEDYRNIYDGVPLPAHGEPFIEGLTRFRRAAPHDYASTRHQPAPQIETPVTSFPPPIQAAYDNLTALPPRPSVARRASRVSLRQRRGESLPSDLVKEAERLGQEGWKSLHAAEEAWSTAMGTLAEMLQTSSEGSHGHSEFLSSGGHDHHPTSLPNTSHTHTTECPSGQAPRLREGTTPTPAWDSILPASTSAALGLEVRPRVSSSSPEPQPVRATTPVYWTNLSQLDTSNDGQIPAQAGMSIPVVPLLGDVSLLPSEADMVSPTFSTASASASASHPPEPELTGEYDRSPTLNDETICARPKNGNVHAYSNPLIRPQSPPTRLSPPSHLMDTKPERPSRSRGYTDEQLGGNSLRRSSGPDMGSGSGTGTGKGSSLSVASVGLGRNGSRSKAGNKLSKERRARTPVPIPVPFIRESADEGMVDPAPGGDEGGTRGGGAVRGDLLEKGGKKEDLMSSTSTRSTRGEGKGKKHWWSRKKE